MTPTIDQEFRSLIPPLSPEELAQLEANIIKDGCRDPLVVWGGILIDGHNRIAICQRHGLSFETVGMEFETRAHARIWIRNNQAGRRNLTTAWLVELALGNKADLAEIGNKRQGARTDLLSENDKMLLPPPVNTRDEIAKAAGVSAGQVGMAERIKKKSPELWEKTKAGDVSISTAYQQVRRVQKEETREARREENRAKVADAATPGQIAESGARFATIMIDPPWDWWRWESRRNQRPLFLGFDFRNCRSG